MWHYGNMALRARELGCTEDVELRAAVRVPHRMSRPGQDGYCPARDQPACALRQPVPINGRCRGNVSVAHPAAGADAPGDVFELDLLG